MRAFSRRVVFDGTASLKPFLRLPQETIQHSDLPTQILYNRTMVQLGLCAFRHGNVKDSHNALLDIQSGGRAKELLAQGLLPQVTITLASPLRGQCLYGAGV